MLIDMIKFLLRRDSDAASCLMIDLTSSLSSEHLDDMIDYLQSFRELCKRLNL